MNKKQLIQKIKANAKKDEKNRNDPRYLQVMGFLISKGFLRTNQDIIQLPKRHINIDDAIWAGKTVEPRILEVLPAAVLRLPRYFDFDPEKHSYLKTVTDQLKAYKPLAIDFYGIPFKNMKVWINFPLLDGRIKPLEEKRALKTFRFKPDTILCLKNLAKQEGASETEIIENLLFKKRFVKN